MDTLFRQPRTISASGKDSQLLSRKEIAGYLGISLVTLTDWMRRGFWVHFMITRF